MAESLDMFQSKYFNNQTGHLKAVKNFIDKLDKLFK